MSCKDSSFLCVDVGLKTAFGCFDYSGKVLWLQSRRFSSSAKLRKGIPAVLRDAPDFNFAVLEGGGTLARIWQKNLDLKKCPNHVVQAEIWRKDLLYPREQSDGGTAKQAALDLFAEVLTYSEQHGVYSKQHDAAEVTLCGFWWAWKKGGVRTAPPALRKRIVR